MDDSTRKKTTSEQGRDLVSCGVRAEKKKKKDSSTRKTPTSEQGRDLVSFAVWEREERRKDEECWSVDHFARQFTQPGGGGVRGGGWSEWLSAWRWWWVSQLVTTLSPTLSNVAKTRIGALIMWWLVGWFTIIVIVRSFLHSPTIIGEWTGQFTGSNVTDANAVLTLQRRANEGREEERENKERNEEEAEEE
jgi:hypothetical protein